MKKCSLAFFLLALLVFSACNNSSNPMKETSVGFKSEAIDSVGKFLVQSCVNDFHAHNPFNPPASLRFQDSYIGYAVKPGGERIYRMCGKYQSATPQQGNEWTPFVTLKTSGYEQWLGTSALAFCQDSTIVWDMEKDWSPVLQSTFDSL